VITYPAFNWGKDTSTYVTFFPKFSAFIPQVQAFKATIKTSNSRFNSLMKMAVDADVENAAMHFILTPRRIHPTKEQYPAYYHKFAEPAKYKSTRLLELGEGVEILNMYTTFYTLYTSNKDSKGPDNRWQYNAELFGNDTLKGAYIANAYSFEPMRRWKNLLSR
jgi:beta-glucosidase/6-phospho-beta-glucosidase/beta-galactosidase